MAGVRVDEYCLRAAPRHAAAAGEFALKKRSARQNAIQLNLVIFQKATLTACRRGPPFVRRRRYKPFRSFTLGAPLTIVVHVVRRLVCVEVFPTCLRSRCIQKKNAAATACSHTVHAAVTKNHLFTVCRFVHERMSLEVWPSRCRHTAMPPPIASRHIIAYPEVHAYVFFSVLLKVAPCCRQVVVRYIEGICESASFQEASLMKHRNPWGHVFRGKCVSNGACAVSAA